MNRGNEVYGNATPSNKMVVKQIEYAKNRLDTAKRIADGTPSALYNIATNLKEAKAYIDAALNVLG